MKTPSRRQYTVTIDEEGFALLDFLAQRLKVSRRCAKRLLDERNVFVSGHRTWMTRHKLKAGDTVQFPLSSATTPAAPEPRILYRDDAVLAVDKSCGFEVVGAHGMEAALRKQLKCASLRAVHRLDRDTTGCLLFAMSPAVASMLVTQFKQRTVRKIYEALVFGEVAFQQRSLRMPLDGQSAISHARRLHIGDGITHLEVRIETGRTHQIRRHLAAIGHPLLGDKHYGAGTKCPAPYRDIERQMLHAKRLQIRHPQSGVLLKMEAPLPVDFRECILRARMRQKEKRKKSKEIG